LRKKKSIFSGTVLKSFTNKLQTLLAGGKVGLTVQTILLGLRRGGAKGQRVNSTCNSHILLWAESMQEWSTAFIQPGWLVANRINFL
jgi:hypothetical protein